MFAYIYIYIYNNSCIHIFDIFIKNEKLKYSKMKNWLSLIIFFFIESISIIISIFTLLNVNILFK